MLMNKKLLMRLVLAGMLLLPVPVEACTLLVQLVPIMWLAAGHCW